MLPLIISGLFLYLYYKTVYEKPIPLKKDKIEIAITNASRKYNIPKSWIKTIIKIESNFNPTLIGKAGEIGLMQIMRSTYKYHRSNRPISDLYDINKNVDFGTWYFSKYYKRFRKKFSQSEAVKRAVICYNAGIGYYKRTFLKTGRIPRITRAYIKKFFKYQPKFV